MKTQVKERYHSNGNLWFRYHLTTDGKRHGFYESYKSDSSISCLCYWNNYKLIKLENNYYPNKIYITYYL